jgi:hypothetical protein
MFYIKIAQSKQIGRNRVTLLEERKMAPNLWAPQYARNKKNSQKKFFFCFSLRGFLGQVLVAGSRVTG